MWLKCWIDSFFSSRTRILKTGLVVRRGRGWMGVSSFLFFSFCIHSSSVNPSLVFDFLRFAARKVRREREREPVVEGTVSNQTDPNRYQMNFIDSLSCFQKLYPNRHVLYYYRSLSIRPRILSGILIYTGPAISLDKIDKSATSSIYSEQWLYLMKLFLSQQAGRSFHVRRRCRASLRTDGTRTSQRHERMLEHFHKKKVWHCNIWNSIFFLGSTELNVCSRGRTKKKSIRLEKESKKYNYTRVIIRKFPVIGQQFLSARFWEASRWKDIDASVKERREPVIFFNGHAKSRLLRHTVENRSIRSSALMVMAAGWI